MATTSDIQPLDLTPEQRQHIKSYLNIYYSFVDMKFEKNPLDGAQVTEYLCEVHSTRSTLERMYDEIPQIVKDEKLVPNIYEY
jgi:hypothetical protein